MSLVNLVLKITCGGLDTWPLNSKQGKDVEPWLIPMAVEIDIVVWLFAKLMQILHALMEI